MRRRRRQHTAKPIGLLVRRRLCYLTHSLADKLSTLLRLLAYVQLGSFAFGWRHWPHKAIVIVINGKALAPTSRTYWQLLSLFALVSNVPSPKLIRYYCIYLWCCMRRLTRRTFVNCRWVRLTEFIAFAVYTCMEI